MFRVVNKSASVYVGTPPERSFSTYKFVLPPDPLNNRTIDKSVDPLAILHASCVLPFVRLPSPVHTFSLPIELPSSQPRPLDHLPRTEEETPLPCGVIVPPLTLVHVSRQVLEGSPARFDAILQLPLVPLSICKENDAWMRTQVPMPVSPPLKAPQKTSPLVNSKTPVPTHFVPSILPKYLPCRMTVAELPACCLDLATISALFGCWSI